MSPSPASSSPVSPSSPVPSPFSTLPTELIQSIIESTVPLHYHSRTYSSRQSTLRSLCLVSKLFHQIAKPLLFAVIQLGYGTEISTWKETLKREDIAALSREVVVPPHYPYRSMDLNDYFGGYLGLQLLTVSSAAEFDLCNLTGLPSK
jgi:hypothetical protein